MKPFKLIFLILFLLIENTYASYDKNHEKKWEKIITNGSNKIVKFHAWGGSKNINEYINWVGKRVQKIYGINLKHIKIKDTSQAVKKVLYEKISKKNQGGSIDLIWINGENFSSMLNHDLLMYENWIRELPNSKYLDLAKESSLMYDFGIYNEGREMPWGLSQLIYFYDSSKVLQPPKNIFELKNYILKNPGRVTFPQPPDFTGTSFLKQVLSELTNKNVLLKEKFKPNKHNSILNKLWKWLDEVTPFLWKQGKHYTKNYLSLSQLLSDDEIDLSMSFNISFPSNEVLKGNLPLTTKSYISDNGSLANTHYLTIPYNASNPSASKLVVNFLISPEAQLKKQDSNIWGDPNILSFKKLEKKWLKKFNELLEGPAKISQSDLQNKIAEPHPSWVLEIEQEWKKRYGSIN